MITHSDTGTPHPLVVNIVLKLKCWLNKDHLYRVTVSLIFLLDTRSTSSDNCSSLVRVFIALTDATASIDIQEPKSCFSATPLPLYVNANLTFSFLCILRTTPPSLTSSFVAFLAILSSCARLTGRTAESIW